MAFRRWVWLAATLIVGALLPAQAEAAAGQIAADGLDTVLVLDQSGSMKQSDPQRVLLQAASRFVENLGAKDFAGLVVFGGQARAVHPLASVQAEGRRDLLADIAKIRYDDSRTNMAAGIERGLYELKQHGRTGASPILIFLTDGIMDTGSNAKDAEMREWLLKRLLPEARDRGVRIFSIALTEEADYALIREMASVTQGDYYRALSAQEIAGIFDQIHARMSQPRPSAPSSVALPPAPGPASRPESLAAYAWVWILGVPGLFILLAAGLFLTRRLRPTITPRRSQAASSIKIASHPPAEPTIPEASLRDMRSGKSVSLTKRLTRIGRAPDNDLEITERQVSSHHAEVEFRQGHFYVRDLRSTNGTSVNKQPVESETLLKSGDVIRFDEYAYTFFLLGAETETAGTMLREHLEGTMVSEAHKAQPAAPGATETAFMDSGATVDDSISPARCPSHPSFEATELCERCGHQWCALCNPPIPGERVCRQCREARKGQPKDSSSHVNGSSARR